MIEWKVGDLVLYEHREFDLLAIIESTADKIGYYHLRFLHDWSTIRAYACEMHPMEET